MPNKLIHESSPYLLQHANNPVDWYPWGDEALGRAVQEDKPILLSIGYSACHWCHVMERECFESENIASIMNTNFVNIKVDREERPDLDTIYMEAVQAMTGRGGWPLTVFLTPQGLPFYGGTYFPPEDRGGLPGFGRVLQTVAHTYSARKAEITSAASELVANLNRPLEVSRVAEPLTEGVLKTAFAKLRSDFDGQNGGLGGAPKFPQPMILEFLLRYHHRTGDKESLSMVELTLERMAKGGIYDQLGGGFHRYSVDERWLVPHFEKMLYDNALLSRVYLHAFQATGKALYRRIVEGTLDYVLREMTDKDGGFYSTQDADSEGVEGKYYVWSQDEVMGILGKADGEVVSRYFGITDDGNFEGKNILSQVIENEALASEAGINADELSTMIAKVGTTLLEKRSDRIPPHRDEKILTDWNGLMLASLAEAASVLDRKDYLEAAIANATFLTQALRGNGVLKHSYRDGHSGAVAYLLDYASLCEGLLSLYQATFEGSWLNDADNLLDTVLKQFQGDHSNIFYDTGCDQEKLVIRPRNIFDNAVPSGSSLLSFVLLWLGRLNDNSEYENLAAGMIRTVKDSIARYPSGFGNWLCALDFYLSTPKEIVVIGRPEKPVTRSLMDAINRRYLPNKILAGWDPDRSGQRPDIPLLRDRGMIENKPTAYICADRVCLAPVTDSDALAAQLDAV